MKILFQNNQVFKDLGLYKIPKEKQTEARQEYYNKQMDSFKKSAFLGSTAGVLSYALLSFKKHTNKLAKSLSIAACTYFIVDMGLTIKNSVDRINKYK